MQKTLGARGLVDRPIIRPLHPFAVLLRERGLTYADAAAAIGVTMRAIKLWTSWTRLPRTRLRERLAAELGADYFPALASFVRRHPERRRIRLGAPAVEPARPPSSVLVTGDALEVLRGLPSESCACVVTSPPYFGLRDYRTEGQVGGERTVDAYVARLVAVFAEVRRVLRKDGTLWLNIGDSHTSGNRTTRAPDKRSGARAMGYRPPTPAGLKAKDLIGIPWRVAFALQADGWILRQEIIWSKPNSAPESVKDRPARAHEQLFLLSKSQRYYFDAESLREPVAAGGSRKKRSVWSISPTTNRADDHLAPFPEKLAEPCLRAGSRPGDLVLDPFSGSGTTGVVALRLRRSFVGIDIVASSTMAAAGRLVESLRVV